MQGTGKIVQVVHTEIRTWLISLPRLHRQLISAISYIDILRARPFPKAIG